LGVHRSTVYRELERNSKQYSRSKSYTAGFAQQIFEKRKQIRPYHKKTGPDIERRITWLLKQHWSPEQIASVCARRNIPMLSFEGIYLWIYDKKKQGADYTYLLRRGHRKRRKRASDRQPRCIIKNRVSISERPEVVEMQKRTGDMEVDLVKCTNGYLLTITDRKSLLNLIRKIPNKTAAAVQKAMTEALMPIKEAVHTITSDNGTEFARHDKISETLDVKWYFADAYSSWQRGCNENQNGLIRQYANRKKDLDTVSEATILEWQKKLNYRPRKKINFDKPIHLFNPNLNVALAT
jgi:IS30 family transposase